LGICLQNIADPFPPIRLITPWKIVFNEKLLVAEPVKKLPAYYGIRKFKAPFT
jgi:hypothetical protein